MLPQLIYTGVQIDLAKVKCRMCKYRLFTFCGWRVWFTYAANFTFYLLGWEVEYELRNMLQSLPYVNVQHFSSAHQNCINVYVDMPDGSSTSLLRIFFHYIWAV